jgi:hypothetical protein
MYNKKIYILYPCKKHNGVFLLKWFVNAAKIKGRNKFREQYIKLGCALTFASEAKFEIEAKISFRLEVKKSLISHDSLRCETPKI